MVQDSGALRLHLRDRQPDQRGEATARARAADMSQRQDAQCISIWARLKNEHSLQCPVVDVSNVYLNESVRSETDRLRAMRLDYDPL